MGEDDPQISYSVKEVLARIEGKVDDFLRALAFKADETKVNLLADRMTKAEDRLTVIEHAKEAEARHSQWRVEWRRWLIPTLLTGALALASLLPLFMHL